MCHLCSAVLTYFVIYTVHGDWFMHVSSVLNSHFGSKTRDSRMLHTTPFVSWIVLAFVGLRELSELVVWTKAPDRAETCDVLEERDFTRLRLRW